MEGFHKNLGHNPSWKDFERTLQVICEWMTFIRLHTGKRQMEGFH